MLNKKLSYLPILVVLVLLAFVTDAQAKKPKVLMLGDSITMQHSPYVIELMEGEADVYRCTENASWTGRLLKELLDDILDAENCKWDIIYFNVGNWDITPVSGKFIRKNPGWGFVDGKAKTSLLDYEKNLAEIIRRLRKHSPNVKLIFATTTLIPEVGAEGVEQYNRSAVKVMQKNNVPVLDLYTTTKPHTDLLLYKNNTHFSKDANALLIGPYVATTLKSFIKDGTLPTSKAATTLVIPKKMVPALEKERDLGHPKHRNKKKK